MHRMRSYTAGNIKIQYLIAGLFCLGVLGGCSHVTVPMGANNVDTPTVITGTIPSSTDIAYSDINDGDRRIIAENLDAIGVVLKADSEVQNVSLPWLNSLSGNSGTLSNIDTAALGETGCLSFQTTANTIAGIKLYSGTACRDISQSFAVTTLSVADA
jgi:17 kDa outer membrane surface antigen